MGFNFEEFRIDTPKAVEESSNQFSDFVIEEPTATEQFDIDMETGFNPALAVVNAAAKSMSKQQTPEELINEGFSVFDATALSTVQEVVAPFLSFGNAILGGLPSAMASSQGVSDAFTQKELNIAGLDIHPALVNIPTTIAGFTRGPLKLAKTFAAPLTGALTTGGSKALGVIANSLNKSGITSKVATKLATGIGSELSRDTLSGALQWGLASGANTPEGELKNWEGRKGRATAGFIGGGIFGAAQNRVKKISQMINKEIKVADTFRKNIKGGFKQRSTDYEKSMYYNSLQTPRVDLTSQLDKLSREEKFILEGIAKIRPKSRTLKIPAKEGIDILKAKRTVIPATSITEKSVVQNEFSRVGKLMNNKDKVTGRQLQDAINEVKDSFSKSKLSGKGLRSGDKAVDNLIDKLVGIKHKSFPGTEQIDDAYGAMSDKLKIFENMKLGNTLPKMRAAVKDKEQSKALVELVGKPFFKKVKDTVLFGNLSNQSVGIVTTFLKYGIVYKMMQKTFNKGIGNADFGGGGGEQ